MRIPFTKAHGARNDFLLTWSTAAPPGDRRMMARAICDRHTGVGADGWLLVTPASSAVPGADGGIRLYNSDGSDSEISGNGTRCAAAFLIESGVTADEVRIATGAGVKHIRVLERREHHYLFEMNMGRAVVEGQLRFALEVDGKRWDATILNVGNPQCAVFVEDFDFDWRALGKRIEHHEMFPNRTNVSFVREAGPHAIDVVFWERGAGETMSSGTGSTGAAAAATLRGMVSSPVEIRTPAGPLFLRRAPDGDLYLTGPAEIIAGGEFYWESEPA
ncbi:MAG: diaminopimelate epimerase [Bryobacterales bacterium]|nr:diaminopimelate epimerase [Bryobacterales bacterium]